MTINDTWGFKSYDTNFKSTETLLRNLIDIASKGGNYLLNVGPDSHGVVPAPEADRLREMGRWLAVNGEAIYGTQPTLFGAEAGSFSATEKDSRGNPSFVPAWDWRSTTAPRQNIYRDIQLARRSYLPHRQSAAKGHQGISAGRLRAHAAEVYAGPRCLIFSSRAKPLDPIATVLVLETK